MMGLDTWVGVGVGLIVISGGIIARIKGDYFSRGMGIALFTNIFGIIALLVSRRSNARKKDEQDIQKWPTNAYIAVFATMSIIFILLLMYWFK
jgi:hypothetical protein